MGDESAESHQSHVHLGSVAVTSLHLLSIVDRRKTMLTPQRDRQRETLSGPSRSPYSPTAKLESNNVLVPQLVRSQSITIQAHAMLLGTEVQSISNQGLGK